MRTCIEKERLKMKLYYHKTDGGAEYLTDKFIECDNGHKEGTFQDAEFIVRIDGNIAKDAELTITKNNALLEACKDALEFFVQLDIQRKTISGISLKLNEAISQAESE